MSVDDKDAYRRSQEAYLDARKKYTVHGMYMGPGGTKGDNKYRPRRPTKLKNWTLDNLAERLNADPGIKKILGENRIIIVEKIGTSNISRMLDEDPLI